MTFKTCLSTTKDKGCGFPFPLSEFTIVRVNERTGNIIRKRLCIACEKKARRRHKEIKKRVKIGEFLEHEAKLYKFYNELTRTV
jgi:hypothetical protein